MAFETWLDVDLKKPNDVIPLKGVVFSQDEIGNRVGVKVFDDGEPATLSGTVTGYVIRADGNTVLVTNGQVAGNKAWIDLPAAAYAVVGVLQIAIRLTNGNEKVVLGACSTHVRRTTTDAIVDPDHVIPSIEELLAQIERMEADMAMIENMSVSATQAAGSTPNAIISLVNGHYHITFDLVKGDTGDTGKGISSAKVNQDYTLTLNFTDGTSYTSGSIRGETGNGIAGAVLNADYTLTLRYTDGNTYTTPSIRGEIGPEAKVTNTVVTYQESASSAAPPSGTWLNAIPQPLTQGYFLWIKTQKTWSNGQTSIEYSLSRQGVDGSGAVSTVSVGNGSPISPDANGNIALPSDATPTENSSNIVSSGGVASAIGAVADDVTDLTTRVGAAESDIDDLFSRLDGAKFKTFSISNGGLKTLTFSNTSHCIAFFSSTTKSGRGMAYCYCTRSTSTPNYVDVPAQSNPTYGLSAETQKLKISNNTGYALNVLLILVSGTLPSVS